MSGTKITRIIIVSVPKNDDLVGISARFEELPSLCTKSGAKYIAKVRARRTIEKYTANKAQNLIIEIHLDSEEDLEYFLHEDQVHQEVVGWAKPLVSDIQRFAVRS